MKALMPVVEVRHSPAMFQNERDVSIEILKDGTGPKRCSLLVDSCCVRDGRLLVRILEQGDITSLVELPNETWNDGRRVRVPTDCLIRVLG